jgi:hypothetical protein
MAFTFDPTTDRGKVRLLIQDDTEQHDGIDIYFFTDAKIDAYLELNDDETGDARIRLAAADALDSWASNEAMVTKRIKQLDISTDGPAVAASLRAHADKLRELAERASSDAGFDVAELALGPFSEREQTVNKAIRDE